MNLKNIIVTIKNILKKTNYIIYIPQYIFWRLFKKPLFKKIKINKLIFNTLDSDDILHLNEYINNYYDIENIKNINICVDVGANSGDFSIMLSKKCKKIYAIEPIDFIYQKMLKNISDNKITNIQTYNFGLSNRCGKVNLLIPKNHTGGSRIDKNGNYEIKIISWSKFYEIIGKPKTIDLLKIDCEGCEYSLLEDSYILDYVKNIRMELHISKDKDKCIAKKMVRLFYKKGFVYANMTLEESNNYINKSHTIEHFFIKDR